MKDLITNDTSRCNNHRCEKNLNCKRYVQLRIDFLQKGHKASDKHFAITRFESYACLNYKPIK